MKTPDDGDILVDFSKNRLDGAALRLLLDLVSQPRFCRRPPIFYSCAL